MERDGESHRHERNIGRMREGTTKGREDEINISGNRDSGKGRVWEGKREWGEREREKKERERERKGSREREREREREKRKRVRVTEGERERERKRERGETGRMRRDRNIKRDRSIKREIT